MQNTAQNYPDSVESYCTRPVNKDRFIYDVSKTIRGVRTQK